MTCPAPLVRALVPVSLLLASACAAPGAVRGAPVVASVATKSLHPADYEAHLAPGALRFAEVTSYDLEDPFPEPTDSTTYVDVSARVLLMDASVAEELLGWAAHDKRTIRVDRPALEEALDPLVASGAIEQVSAPRLMVLDGQRGSIAIVNQSAYIEGFDVRADAGVLLADPVVGIAEEGVMLLARPWVRPDGDVDLHLEITSIELEDPIEDRQVLVPGARSPVSVQLPISSLQRLTSVAPLSGDECLVVGCLPEGDDAFVFVVLTATVPGT